MTTVSPALWRRSGSAASAARPASDFVLTRCPHPLVEQLYTSRRVTLGNGTDLPMDVFIPREEGDFLYSIVRHLRPRRTIEVGMANGLSTLFIAAALADNAVGEHTAIDPFQSGDWRGAGVSLVARAGLDSRVTLRENFSHQALPQFEHEGVRFQFAFVDGAHLFDYVIADFLCLDRLLDVGGLLAFDDSDWPAVRRAIRFILANRDYEVAFPHIVIEPRRPTPTAAARVIRSLGKMLPRLGGKLRPDFLIPDEDAMVQGRCVVLRKLGEDCRNSQSRCHVEF